MLAVLTAAQRVLLQKQIKKEELYNEEDGEVEDTVEERKVNDSFLYARTATKLAMNMAQAAKLASNYSLSSVR